LKHAFWHEPVTIWPLLCLLAGVASITLYNAVVLGLVCLACAYAARLVLVRLWLQFQSLSRYALPAGDLRSHTLDLAQRVGVSLKEIYLLPSAEGRLDAPYMIFRRRLFLSDALLRALCKHETEAVLAREFAHLRHRHRDVMVGAAVVALPVIYRFSHLPIIVGTLPWAIRGPLLVWLTPVILYFLWRRFERTAEAEASQTIGDRQTLPEALLKLSHLNVLGMYWRRFERRVFSNDKTRHPSDEFPSGPSTPRSLVSADS
jgi:Zn-dependent protease with chaperone function